MTMMMMIRRRRRMMILIAQWKGIFVKIITNYWLMV